MLHGIIDGKGTLCGQRPAKDDLLYCIATIQLHEAGASLGLVVERVMKAHHAIKIRFDLTSRSLSVTGELLTPGLLVLDLSRMRQKPRVSPPDLA